MGTQTHTAHRQILRKNTHKHTLYKWQKLLYCKWKLQCVERGYLQNKRDGNEQVLIYEKFDIHNSVWEFDLVDFQYNFDSYNV